MKHKIVELLNKHIQDNKLLLNEKQENEELIKNLEQLILQIETRSDMCDLKKELELNRDRLIKRNEELLRITNKNYYTVKSAAHVINCILKGIPFKDDIQILSNVKFIIGHYETQGLITTEEEMLLCNELEFYNKDRKYCYREYYRLPNMINLAYEEPDKIAVANDRKSKLDKMADSLKIVIAGLEKEDMVENLKYYQSFDLRDNEYEYIINKLLERYIDEMLGMRDMLNDKEFHSKHSDKKFIIDTFYEILNKYLVVREFYLDYKENMLSNEELIETEVEEYVIENKKQLIFSNNGMNVKFLNDLDDIPYEYYVNILELMNRLREGSLSKKELKNIGNVKKSCRGFTEIKSDQIRIVFKHVKDDIYCVLGLFIKKADNDRKSYQSLFNRLIPKIEDEEALASQLLIGEQTIEELKRIVEDKGRSLTR